MNVRMELLRENHLQQVMEWRMRPDITRFMNTDPELNIDTQKKWFERIKNDSTQRHWVICVDDVPSGSINLVNIDYINKRCNWGYYIANQLVRSLKLAMYLEWNLYDYVFQTLKLNKLCNETFVLNNQVIQLHDLCGSKKEGILRQHVFKNGTYYDISVGSILSSEWETLRSKTKFEYFLFE